jgi:hypothetical protein
MPIEDPAVVAYELASSYIQLERARINTDRAMWFAIAEDAEHLQALTGYFEDLRDRADRLMRLYESAATEGERRLLSMWVLGVDPDALPAAFEVIQVMPEADVEVVVPDGGDVVELGR